MNNFAPKTRLGIWSVGLNALFIIVIASSIFLVEILGVLSYDDRWWDVTVPIVALATITALIVGIRAIRNKEYATSVYISVALSICAVLFLLLHSLFIND